MGYYDAGIAGRQGDIYGRESHRDHRRDGADFRIMPCNTAHAYLAQIRSAVSIPVLSLIEETVRAVLEQTSNARVVGLIGSTAVVHTQLCAQPLEEAGIATVVPDESSQTVLMPSLYAIKSGEKGAAVMALLLKVANEPLADRAQAVLLA